MKKLICSAALAGAVSFAQAPPAPPVPPPAAGTIAVFPANGGGPVTRAMAIPDSNVITTVGAEFAFESQFVKGVPFSAEFVTESVQTLADGNRIVSKRTEVYARDGEGRTRREMPVGPIGPFAKGESPTTVFIHDPVGRVDWILEPMTKTARKIQLPEGRPMILPAPENAAAVTVFHRELPPPPPHAPAPAVPAAPGNMAFRVDRPPIDADRKTEDLGKQVIEGVEAQGTRTTMTIPAGAVGNERPLVSVSERWYSNDLKTVVMMTRKDPRIGETTYRATNLRRGEPGLHLFEPPADYTVADGHAPLIQHMRQMKKPNN